MKKFLWACTAILSMSAPAFAEKVVITYATTNVAFSALFAAQEMGEFSKLGLDVDLQKLDSGATAAAAVVAGSADAYVSTTLALPGMRAQGLDVVAIGTIVSELVANLVISKDWAEKHNLTEQSPYAEKLAAMKGMRIAIAGPGSGPDQVARYLALEAGLNPDSDIELVKLSSDIAANMAALGQNAVDAIILGTPAPELAQKGLGAVNLIDFSRGDVPSMVDFPYGVLVVTRDWLEQKPETAIKLNIALQRALDSLRDPARTDAVRQAVVGKYVAALDEDVIAKIWSDIGRYLPETIEITPAMIERVIRFTNLFAQTKSDPARAADYVASEPAAKALAEAR